MAFSFRAGTNWCHDFPKLARESGFCFNLHRTRVRVDWNRIGSIDIDRVIRERDFLTVDDNVYNVVDYSLEAEYDVKILDPNFVKLFRLAQLSVEYLLYCKQYLDHSVVILKDELRMKIEENASLEKDLKSTEETVKELKEKMKERNRYMETKLYDTNGELFKCPHCTKTFISSTFASAHVARRHPNLSDPYVSGTSPVHEQYRAETEKLHNEIKSLKERLNQTERVIRSESERVFDVSRMEKGDEASAYEKGERTLDKEREDRLREQQKKYQDEITSLKNMLFNEIKNLKQRDRSSSPIRQVEIDTSVMNLKELMRKQELEIETLKERLRDKMMPDLTEVHEKLQIQERHWKSVVDRLERQHRMDTENLMTQLQLNEETARQTKELYESKVKDLETHSMSQTKMINAQGEQLMQLSHDIWESRDLNRSKTSPPNKSFRRHANHREESVNRKNEDLVLQNFGSTSSHESPSSLATVKLNTMTRNSGTLSHSHRKHSGSGDCQDENSAGSINVSGRKKSAPPRENRKSLNLASTESALGGKIGRASPRANNFREDIVETFRANVEGENRLRRYDRNGGVDRNSGVAPREKSPRESRNMKSSHESPKTKPREVQSRKLMGNVANESAEDSEEDSDEYSETESETDDTESESNFTAENQREEKEDENSVDLLSLRESFSQLIIENPDLLVELQSQLKDRFANKLRDLGIDPEWNGIPNATFRQKIETVAHHRNINSKKFSSYNRLRQKITNDISQKLIEKRQVPRTIEKLSPLEKIMNKVRNKAATVLKHQKNVASRTPVIRSQSTTPRDRNSRSMSNLELLPKKMIKSEFHEKDGEKFKFSYTKDPEAKPRKNLARHSETPNTNKKQGILTKKHSVEALDKIKYDERSVDSLSKPTETIANSPPKDNRHFSKPLNFPFHGKKMKVTSTPNKSGDEISEKSYTSIEEESDHFTLNSNRDHSLPASPKNNKSVLKSATGSVGSLVKKKVLFDLENGKRSESIGDEEETVKNMYCDYEFRDGKKDDDDEDWNISSISADDVNMPKEKSPIVDNIVLKTTQSDNIARISKKIQEQLNIARQKPFGGTEAMFSSNLRLNGNENDANYYRSSTSLTSSILESPKRKQGVSILPMETEFPKPTPRRLRKQESDLESDIEELLQMK